MTKRETYPDWLKQDYDVPTPSLAEFLAEYEKDDNVFWMLACGHHQNLLEEAVATIHEFKANLIEMAKWLKEVDVTLEALDRIAKHGTPDFTAALAATPTEEKN